MPEAGVLGSSLEVEKIAPMALLRFSNVADRLLRQRTLGAFFLDSVSGDGSCERIVSNQQE
jgi:hypothetical protein